MALARALACLGLAACASALSVRGTSTDLAAAAPLRARNAAAGLPLPSQAQLSGTLQHPFTLFMHYSMCSYTGCQWNTATSPAQDFAPPDAGPNATQWALAAKLAGATQICLTVRHVGGFTLWPSASTNYSVANSTWRGGMGDVVAEFTSAMRAAGLGACLYIIIGFDVEQAHAQTPGPLFLERQVMALTELLTQYGPISRLWWDNYAIGCCQPVTHPGFYCPGGGTTSTPSSGCPGWQVVIDLEVFGGTYPLYHATSVAQNSYTCTEASTPLAGPYFAVVESDLSVTIPGWFWNAQHNTVPAQQLLEQFTLKAEQGANLILNVPPNSTGVVEDALLEQLGLFAAARAGMLSRSAGVLPAPVSLPCAGMSITLPIAGAFDTVVLTEDLVAGQVIGSYTLEARDAASGAWRALSAGVHGKTVGLRLLDSVGLQTGVSALRFNCSSDLAPAPPPAGGEVSLVNAAGQCMSMAENATWPCYTGSPQPGDGPFSLCPLVAAPCSAPGAAWTLGQGHSFTAARVAADAVANVDCNACAPGTHAKLIASATCPRCASGLSFNASEGAVHVDACPGMCLSNARVGGAVASCAGNEPWVDTQVHLVPCAQAQGAAGWQLQPAPAQAPVATLAFLGAFLNASAGQ